ncbi:MAG: BamA/TamA family outer membrane protein, partial [Bacteroidales bacterium]|nr:BamA/TamA family outer membrane protein [Bacteroidales bacterium]
MKYFKLNKNIYSINLVAGFILLVIINSCNPTKYIPQEASLLEKSDIMIDNNKVKKADIQPYIKQTPNKRIFGTRFHLGLYNLSNIEKNRWPHGWLRNIGEEPVVFDPFAASKSVEQIENYLFSKGYFNVEADADYFERKKKTNIIYEITTKEPYKIRKVIYNLADTTIGKFIYMDSINCLVESGRIYDVDILQAERVRIERLIKDIGFYSFSREQIYFKVDSTIGNNQVDVEYEVRMMPAYGYNNRIIELPYQRYRIRGVYIYTDFDPKEALAGVDDYLSGHDTITYKDYFFVSDKNDPTLKFDVIIQSLYIKPSDIFQVTNMERTQAHLNSLHAYRLVNVRYQEVDPSIQNEWGELFLDCVIQLTPVSQQSYSIELEGTTNSAGNLGGAVNLIYNHKNLFRGAEQLNVKLKGAYEALSEEISGSKSFQEYGFETSLTLPKFLLPFLEKESFIKKYNPKSVIQVAYNYQKMPVYTRTVANATFGYNWKSGRFTAHNVNPLQFNIVNLPYIDPDFEMKIDSTSYLAYSYKDMLILGSNYIYTFNNQNIKKSKDYWFIKFKGEMAGNLAALVASTTGSEKRGNSYTIFGQPFAQYFRGDIDLRYYRTLNEFSSVVYRGFAGVGVPYGNSKVIPFEKQFFGGGANGVRAWQVRSLGPGSYTP